MKLNRNDKLLLYTVIFIVIVIISLIVSLFFIWRSREESGVTSYTYLGFEEEVVAMYQKQLQILLKENNTRLLAQKLDEQFLTDTNLSRDNLTTLKQYLTNKSLFSIGRNSIADYTVSANEDTGVVVYRFKYYNLDGKLKYVNLIETEPYAYTISFENEYTSTSAKKSVIDSTNGVKFELSLQESKENSLKYNAKITNISDEKVQFDFNNVASVELKLEDGNKVKLSSVIASNDDYILAKDSYINQELFFAIPLDKQGEIKSIIFYNVLIGENKTNLEIEF